jgi:HAD superfamily hydrolase (TIGR01458 family)
MIKAVLLDLAGVIYEGDEAIAGSVEAVARLRAKGLPIRFVSNTTRSPRRAVLDRLAGFGLAVEERELFTPAQAARQWLRQHECSPHLLVHPDFEVEFEGLPEATGRAVIVGDVGPSLDYARLNGAFRELTRGAQLLALANNRSFRDADGELSLDAGAVVAALEFASRTQAIVLGKPSPEFFLSALADMGCEPGEAVMVGDDAESDVAGARKCGLEALLVRTGKYRPGDEKRFEPAPSAVIANLAEAADWILARQADL